MKQWFGSHDKGMAGVLGSHRDSFLSFPLQTLGADVVFNLAQAEPGPGPLLFLVTTSGRAEEGTLYQLPLCPSEPGEDLRLAGFGESPRTRLTGMSCTAWHWSHHRPGSATSHATWGNPPPGSEPSPGDTEMGDAALVGAVV